jgi:hypothetical protein
MSPNDPYQTLLRLLVTAPTPGLSRPVVVEETEKWSKVVKPTGATAA